MATSSFVALSGQLALEARLSTIAHNIANARTAAFRAGGVSFSPLASPTENFETVFASTGHQHVNTKSGGMSQTGNPLDIAVQGEGFLAYSGPQGSYYSRDGRLTMTNTGELVNELGHTLQDIGGAAITLDSESGVASIAKDGSIYQKGQKAGQIGMFKIDLSAGFSRAEGSGLVPVSTAEQLTDFAENGVLEGFVEESNVNPITEMVKLIQVTRAFESASTFADRMFDSELDAIKALGSR